MGLNGRWLIPLVVTALCGALVGPFQTLDRSVGLFDLPVHAFVFGAVTVCLVATARKPLRRPIFLSVVLLAIGIEGVQGLILGGTEIGDILAGVSGAGIMAMTWPRRRRRRRRFTSF